MKNLLYLVLLGLLLLGSFVDVRCQDDEDDVDLEDAEDDGPVADPDPLFEKPKYKTPKASGPTYFTAVFDSPNDLETTWIMSQAKKDGAEEELAKYDGQWAIEEAEETAMEGDKGLVLKTAARHHAVSAKLDKPFTFSGKPFIVQYEVRFQKGMECGGAYVKLLSDSPDLDTFTDKTPYTIMFGPDKCGNDAKLHFIFRHKNPKTGEFEEKHAKKPSSALEGYFNDKKTHLFTLVVKPDNDFEVYVDQDMINSGNLLEDMEPPVNPKKEIDDPKDAKPANWDEREKIDDPEATKPEDWDEDAPAEIPDDSAVKPEGWLDNESELIADPDAVKPEDWDDDMDGEWEAPRISNPKCEDGPGCGEWTRPNIKNPEYKGKWFAPRIDNPNYKGMWKPQKIVNPDFFQDTEPYKMTPIGAVGLELWSMTNDVFFDNFLITDDKNVADTWADDTFVIKQTQEGRSASSDKGVFASLLEAAEARPWLYAVYIVVILLPVLLLSIWCCPRNGPIKPETIEARRKKTDEVSPDDAPEEEDEGGAGDKEEEASPAPKKKGKAALDAEPEEESQGSGDGGSQEDEATTDSPGRRSSPRKRKPRKD